MFSVPPNVRPGEPVRAVHQNMVYAALRKLGGISATKNGAFQRSRASASFPFKVSAGVVAGKLEISVESGMWFGDGKTNFAQLESEASGDAEVDAWVLCNKDDTENFRAPMTFEVSPAETVWALLRAKITSDGALEDKDNFPPECVVETKSQYSTGTATGYTYAPVAKIECSQTGGVWSVDRVKQYLKGDFFYGGGSGSSHPFKISYADDGSERRARIAGGLWIGDGVSARGADFNAEYDKVSLGESSFRDIRGMDTFAVDETEFSFGRSTETIYLAVSAATRFGRVCPVDIAGNVSEGILPRHVLKFEALAENTDKERLENLALGMSPEVRFIGKITGDGEVHQFVRDNIRYAPSVQAGMPLYFYPKNEAPNAFECIGGLLLCNIPRTLNPDVSVGHVNSEFAPEGGIASEGISADGLRPSRNHERKRFKLQRRFVPIPRFDVDLSAGASSESDDTRTNGYLVYLRIRMRYDLDNDFLNASITENIDAFPRPEITWELAQIPKSVSTPGKMWEFSTELVSPSETGYESCPATFLGEMPGAKIEIGLLDEHYTSDAYIPTLSGLVFMVPTEEYESIVPIGVFYKPTRQDISEAISAAELRERYLYMPLKRGIVEWTPPIDFTPWGGFYDIPLNS